MKNTLYKFGKGLISLGLGILIVSVSLHAQQVYPSAGAFWVGGSGTYNPTDSLTKAQGLKTDSAVFNWEAHHADFGAWMNYPSFYRNYNNNFTLLDYMYTGQISHDGLYVWEIGFHEQAIHLGHDWENYFLHYSQDTWLTYDSSYQYMTPWAGVPAGVAYTDSSNDPIGVVLPGVGTWSADIFKGVPKGGVFYLVNPDKFGEATLSFAPGGTNGTITVEYASQVNGAYNITQWTPLNLTTDGTNNFHQNGRISWTPPANWVWGYNWSPQLGNRRNFGYWLRITGTGYGQRPILSKLQTRAYLKVDPSGSHQGHLKNLGWDPVNDRNGDGYLEDNEYANLLDPSASARFRYEARLALNNVGFWNYWSPCITNTANAQYQQDIGAYYQSMWGSNGINGGYNDNFFVNLNKWFFPILAGGQLVNEGNIQGLVQDSLTNLAYSTGFVATLDAIKRSTSSSWIGANIYFINPYDYHDYCVPYPALGREMLNANTFDWLISEATIYDSWSMVDASSFLGPFSGLSRIWNIPAWAAAHKKSAIMARIGTNLLTPPSTEAKWERSQMGILAEYYLYHIPNLTSLQTIYTNCGDISQLTDTTNYYKKGVPKNYAYQQHGLMAVDIGTPLGRIPPGNEGNYTPMQYTARVDGTGDLNNTIVGTSISTILNHPVYGEIPVLPTASYYLLSRPTAPYTNIVYDPQGQAFPAEVVVARQFSKGMVVFRTPFTTPTNYQDYISDANEITVNLPEAIPHQRTYFRLNYDGTHGPPTSEVTLHGFEGAILINLSSGGAGGLVEPTMFNNSIISSTESTVLVYPNPCSTQNMEPQINFGQIPVGSNMKLFSMSTGRLIKTMIGLSGTASWDLTNDSGESVASGIYLYAITDPQNNTVRGKVCVIR